MIVIEEVLRKDGVKLIHTFSDNGYKIKQKETQEVYDEALDVLNYTYEETDEKIEGLV